MRESPELLIHFMDKRVDGANPIHNTNERIDQSRNFKRCIRIATYTVFVLFGQATALLLGRLYYDKGGKSKWIGSFVQLGGFPIILPYYFILAPKVKTTNTIYYPPPSVPMLALIYVSLGLLLALDCYFFSVGLLNLPVSTYSLICSSQLAFTAFFSFFINSQKITPLIMNSLILLTISSILLVFQTESEGTTEVSKGKYVTGFICTVTGAAGYSLMLSLTQLAFKKVLKRESFKLVMDMIIYQYLVATIATLVGLFASGDWRSLKGEMEGYKLGKASYFLTLASAAIIWQLFAIGCVGLIFEVSSLFSNAITVLGLPIVPVLAVMFFHDKMQGIKAISMGLAILGFISYVYQQYLDDFGSSAGSRNGRIVLKDSPEEEVDA